MNLFDMIGAVFGYKKPEPISIVAKPTRQVKATKKRKVKAKKAEPFKMRKSKYRHVYEAMNLMALGETKSFVFSQDDNDIQHIQHMIYKNSLKRFGQGKFKFSRRGYKQKRLRITRVDY